jgi:hypothetical protein
MALLSDIQIADPGVESRELAKRAHPHSVWIGRLIYYMAIVHLRPCVETRSALQNKT